MIRLLRTLNKHPSSLEGKMPNLTPAEFSIGIWIFYLLCTLPKEKSGLMYASDFLNNF